MVTGYNLKVNEGDSWNTGINLKKYPVHYLNHWDFSFSNMNKQLNNIFHLQFLYKQNPKMFNKVCTSNLNKHNGRYMYSNLQYTFPLIILKVIH